MTAVRLSWPIRIGYGTAEFGLAAVEIFVQLYLLKFFHVTVGLPAAWAGLALSLAILWDAVSDPVMGGLSDRTRHRGGRRRVYLVPGAALMALSFVALFNPPALPSAPLAFTYLLLAFILLNTGMTLVGVPHAALGAELSSDRRERTALFACKRMFAVFGVLAGTALPAVLLAVLHEDDPADLARGGSALLLAVPIVLAAAITWRATRGHDRPAPAGQGRPSGSALWQLVLDQRQALANPLFRVLLVAFVIAAVGRTLNASLALYYYEFRLGLSEQQAIAGLLLPFFFAFLASLPGWVWLAGRFGRRPPAVFGVLALGASGAVVYPLFPPGDMTGPVIYSVIGGLLAGAIVLLDAMVADTVDYDRLRTRRDREGLYYGVWRMSTKIARALGLLLSGFLLDAIGFQPDAAMTPGVGDRLALLFGPVVGVLFVLGGLVLWRMPLTDALHERIQGLLERRRRRAARVLGAD